MTEKRSFSRRLIQIFNRYLEPGGEEAWVANLEKSFDLPTCYFNSSDWTAPNAPPFWSQALRMIYNPDAISVLSKFHERNKPEAWIIQNAFPTGSAAIYRQAKKLRIPLIQYIHNFRPVGVSGYLEPSDLPNIPNRALTYLNEIKHGSWQQSQLRTGWFAAVLAVAYLLRWFDAIAAWIAPSNFMRDQFIRAGVPSEKIFTLRHFWRPAAHFGSTTDEDFYLFVGRLEELKGILVLLDVWDRIFQDRSNARPKLIIIGEGELARTIRERAKANPLIDFRGSVSVETKRQLLSRMHALVAPSLCLESLGLVAYEAYDFAKPVLAARSGGLGEIVVHNETGLLHEPGDTGMLCDQVTKLQSEPRLRLNLGRNGRAWLSENANVEKWREGFNRIVEFAVCTKA